MVKDEGRKKISSIIKDLGYIRDHRLHNYSFIKSLQSGNITMEYSDNTIFSILVDLETTVGCAAARFVVARVVRGRVGEREVKREWLILARGRKGS